MFETSSRKLLILHLSNTSSLIKHCMPSLAPTTMFSCRICWSLLYMVLFKNIVMRINIICLLVMITTTVYDSILAPLQARCLGNRLFFLYKLHQYLIPIEFHIWQPTANCLMPTPSAHCQLLTANNYCVFYLFIWSSDIVISIHMRTYLLQRISAWNDGLWVTANIIHGF